MTLTTFLLLPALLHLAAAFAARHGKDLIPRPAATLAFAVAAGLAAIGASAGLTPGAWLASGPLQLVMAVLVNLIGVVVVRFAAVSLRGDPAERYCLTWLHLCLAAVNVLVVTNHLLVLWLAWTAISISLHTLLVCYPERFRAVVAAHKKFLFARVAETAVLAAAVLLWTEHGTFRIDDILAAYAGVTTLSATSQAAAVLIALAALIKCAQLPVHGWLIQVVEAPTPVSALLHAGVINLGGFVLILMAPLMMLSEPARWLLLLVAGPTAVLAALVMMTRISIKVRLAWSTSAQMGLMLIECALGLYALALLHLVAHACYKAGAFLASGNAVNDWLAVRMAGGTAPSSPALAIATPVIVGIALALAAGFFPAQFSWAEAATWTLVAVAAAALLQGATGLDALAARAVAIVVMLLAYAGHKFLFAPLVPAMPDAGVLPALWVFSLAVALAIGQATLTAPATPLRSVWHRWLFAGFYLDEAVTRATLRVWPVALPKSLKHATSLAEGGNPDARST